MATADRPALYSPVLLREGKSPAGLVRLSRADAESGIESGLVHLDNPLCGDEITLKIEISPDRIVTSVRHHTRGCLLTLASASVMTQLLNALAVQRATRLSTEICAHIFQSADDFSAEVALCERFSDIEHQALFAEFLEGIRPASKSPARQRCLTLPWEALTQACSG